MNIETGEILDIEEFGKLDPDTQKKYIPVKRDLTAKEIADKQINLYAPCGCGSGEKFKFCCRKNIDTL